MPTAAGVPNESHTDAAVELPVLESLRYARDVDVPTRSVEVFDAQTTCELLIGENIVGIDVSPTWPAALGATTV